MAIFSFNYKIIIHKNSILISKRQLIIVCLQIFFHQYFVYTNIFNFEQQLTAKVNYV